jgi:stage V sporulation protein SpoVS
MADGGGGSYIFDLEESEMGQPLEPPRGRGGGGGGRGGPGQHASRRAQAPDAQPGSDFWDRVQRGHNTTKIGSSTNPRDVASQIAAQARAAVDCPVLQCVGPQSTNQAMKAIAIARTYLRQSDASGETSHPDLTVYPEFVKLSSAASGSDDQLSAVQLAISKRSRCAAAAASRRLRTWDTAGARRTAPGLWWGRHPPNRRVSPFLAWHWVCLLFLTAVRPRALSLSWRSRPSVDKEGRSLKVGTQTDAKSLAGAIASCTREGSRGRLKWTDATLG